jgi:hypothetical protein
MHIQYPDPLTDLRDVLWLFAIWIHWTRFRMMGYDLFVHSGSLLFKFLGTILIYYIGECAEVRLAPPPALWCLLSKVGVWALEYQVS